MKYRLAILCLALIVNLSFGQHSKRDSLLESYHRVKSDSVKLLLLDQLITYYFGTSVDSAKIYINQYLNIASTTGGIHDLYIGNAHASRYYWMRSDPDSVVHYLNKGLILAKELKDFSLEANTYRRLSMLYDYEGDMQQSLVYAQKASHLAEESGDWDLLSRTILREGNLQYRIRKYPDAIKSYQTVDSIITANNTINDYLGSALTNIGLIYMYLDNEKAVSYFQRAIELYDELDFPEGVAHVKIFLADYFLVNNQIEKAHKITKQAQTFYTQYGDQVKDARATQRLAKCFLKANDYDSANYYFQEALKKALKSNQLDRVAKSYVGLAEYAMAIGQNQQAINDFNKAISVYNKVMEDFTLHEKIDIYDRLSNAYLGIYDYKNAHRYLNEFIKWQDTLVTRTNNRLVGELETKYQTEKKEQQIELLNAQNQLAEQEKRNQLYILLGVLALVLILAVVFYILYRNRQKVAMKLQELDSAKSNFFANISHELRTPLTLIKGPIEGQLSKKELDDESYTNLLMVNRNTDRLIELVDQLLDLSKLESGNMHLQVEKGQALDHIRAIASSFQYVANQKNIKFDIEVPTDQSDSWFDKDALEKITVNLLSNAIKYTPEKGEISLVASLVNGSLNLSVRNTGKGISAKEVKNVLQRFYQSDSTREGAGIGLALVNELVLIHKGKLSVKSIENEHATFEVILPVAKENFKSEDLRSTITISNKEPINQEAVVTPVDHDDLVYDETKPLLLIVEDNDDVRKLVSNIFKEDFQLLNAEDGEQGIESAIKNVPDIIISDLMMPVKDGIALCNTLKQDERTSHIPIILLTAKAGDENVVAGLETGADDYMVKPFSNDVLKVKVEKLIELRASLRQRYSQEIILKPQEIAITSADENFLSRVEDLLDKKLTASDFTADVFSKEIGMSRMQLHRKLKALIGLTTSEFIKSQRLKLASQALQKPGVNMSEVAYAVGFNDPSYFSKCFKEAYGYSPSAYAKNKSA